MNHEIDNLNSSDLINVFNVVVNICLCILDAFSLLRRAPRALEGGRSERQHLVGVGREDAERLRRSTKGVLARDIEVWASLHAANVLVFTAPLCIAGT